MPVDYEAEYNNRARVPEHPEIIAGWERDAAAYRTERTGHCELGLAFGATPRQTMDIFWPDNRTDDTPVAMFIHGGYWQALDGSLFSHMARGPNANGVAVAIPSYDLCPVVSMETIVIQMHHACAFLARHVGRGFAVTGHSAGGHLAAAMMATHWPAVGDDLPAGLIRFAMPISGLFDLRPLLETSLNDALRMTDGSVDAISPITLKPPVPSTLVAIVGLDESDEFRRQSKEFGATWANAGVTARYVEVPGMNHFTVIAPLADPDHAMTKALANMARQASSPQATG
ncbi:MAG: alpha/beta hydrolase [Pseudomonadota bacterium]